MSLKMNPLHCILEAPFVYYLTLNDVEFHNILRTYGFTAESMPFENKSKSSFAKMYYYREGVSHPPFVIVNINEAFCLESGLEEADILGLITHEATHVKQQICEFFGESNPGEEIEAYMVQSISTTLFKEFFSRRSARIERSA